MKTISIPVNNRPDHFKRVLDSIHAAEGHEDWSLVFSTEPNADCRVIASAVDFMPSYHLENPLQLGCWHNTFHAAMLAMMLNPSVNLYLEDDYCLSPDALTLVDQWAASPWGGVLLLRRPHASQSLPKPDTVTQEQTGLFGCGFAWRAAMWPIIRHGWFSEDERSRFSMWDIGIAYALRDYPQWRPLVNRSHGIGVIGTHTRGDTDLNLFGPDYSGPPVTKFTFQ